LRTKGQPTNKERKKERKEKNKEKKQKQQHPVKWTSPWWHATRRQRLLCWARESLLTLLSFCPLPWIVFLFLLDPGGDSQERAIPRYPPTHLPTYLVFDLESRTELDPWLALPWSAPSGPPPRSLNVRVIRLRSCADQLEVGRGAKGRRVRTYLLRRAPRRDYGRFADMAADGTGHDVDNG
jgi:hypothetical protein